MNEMFVNFKTFKIYARRMFKDIDTERTVMRELMNLKQKKTASMYTVQFQEILFNLSWDDAALTEQFYRNLKNIVKNNIVWEEQLTTL